MRPPSFHYPEEGSLAKCRGGLGFLCLAGSVGRGKEAGIKRVSVIMILPCSLTVVQHPSSFYPMGSILMKALVCARPEVHWGVGGCSEPCSGALPNTPGSW